MRSSLGACAVILAACGSNSVLPLGADAGVSPSDAAGVDATSLDAATPLDATLADAAGIDAQANDAGVLADGGVCAAVAEACSMGSPPCCGRLDCVPSGMFLVCGHMNGAAIGAACKSDQDCAFVCANNGPFTGGYCTEPIAECAANRPDGGDFNCPSGSVCVNGAFMVANRPDLCAKECAMDNDCRTAEGYHCCPFRGTGVCWPGHGCP
jgi:hypothetical protein